MQTKPRIYNTVRDFERSREKLMMWAAERTIALVLVCESYFIVDIVQNPPRVLKFASGVCSLRLLKANSLTSRAPTPGKGVARPVSTLLAQFVFRSPQSPEFRLSWISVL